MTPPQASLLSTHSAIKEGIKAGALGATGVAAWFFVVDAIGGQLLFTPRAMGGALSQTLGLGVPSPALAIIAYTIFHYAAFIAVATILSAIVHRSMQDPTILAAALLVFVAAEAAFYAFMSVLNAANLFGKFGWLQIIGSNVVGVLLVGVYLWRLHPGLRENLDEGLGTIPERAR